MNLDFLYGFVQLPIWGYALVVFATIQLMFLGITLYLHRDQAHGSLVLHPILRNFFRFWLWFSSGTVTKEWVAVHRKHHVYSDKEGDPHSPVLFGLKKVVLEGYELYAVDAKNPEVVKAYGRGTPDDWMERNVYGKHSRLGVLLFSLIMLVLFGIPAITMVAVHLAAQPFFAAGVVNGLGHHFGYRSFEMESSATNLVPWGLLVAGEELHNNHHAFPRSARFSMQPWEFDIGWMWVKIFSAFGLVREARVAPRPHFAKAPRSLDAETAQALFTNRMHVLRDYARRVVRPVVRELDKAKGALPAGASKLLVRHPNLLREEARQKLNTMLEQHEPLRAVVEFRERLVHLWNNASANQAHAVQQLKQWCVQAEESGIQALQEFARGLQRYAPAPQAA